MKKILLLLISNIFFAQSIPEPKEIVLLPPSYNLENDHKNEDIKDAMIPFIKSEKYGIGIISYKATDDYSSTGATFTIYNSSQKTIKYIWFTVAGENAVGDLVKTGGGYYKTLKGIGPTESNKFGQWSFDYVWLTDIVEYIKLSTIKIQYMDGTFKTIKYTNNLYIGEEAYERALLAVSNQNKVENSNKIKQNNFADVSENDQTVFSDVEFSPEFPGGIGALRKSFGDHFDTSQMTPGAGRVETELTFIIEKDGTMTDIKAEGKNEEFNSVAIQTIKSIKSRWAPAKIKSMKVRSIYKTKFSMNFQ
ncbi:hypothetical protein [Chryseobacterium arthrosphaerae]|uniref:energy transducer TonB n=1 Tax=Chryseobacterium arthrosphaerae TaxID=651561 RepID=UPI0031DD634A